MPGSKGLTPQELAHKREKDLGAKSADTEKQGIGTFWAFFWLYFARFVRYDKDRKCIYRLQGEGVCTKEDFTIK